MVAIEMLLFVQFYIYDIHNEVDNRMRALDPSESGEGDLNP